MKKAPITKKGLSIISFSFFSVHWSLKGYLMDETCGSLRSSMRTQYMLKHYNIYVEDIAFMAPPVYTSQHRVQTKAAISTENT